MFQVRFHGRGGQGVVTAAELLAEAAFGEALGARYALDAVMRATPPGKMDMRPPGGRSWRTIRSRPSWGPGLSPAVRDRLQPGPAGLGRRHQLGGALPGRRSAPARLEGARRCGADG